MTAGILGQLTQLALPAEIAERAGLGRMLQLEKAWPRGPGRLSLNYVTERNPMVAAQWFGLDDGRPDRQRLDRVARRTAADAPDGAVVTLPQSGVLLQPGGADRRLAALRALVSRPGATLTAHRPERRAVVRLQRHPSASRKQSSGEDGSDAGCWAKVVRPGRTAPIVTAADAAATVTGLRQPQLLDHDADRGLTIWSHVTGRALRDALQGTELEEIGTTLGSQLRAFHESGRNGAASPIRNVPVRDASAELRWTRHWVARVRQYGQPDTVRLSEQALRPVTRLMNAGATDLTVIHADLHDGQVLVGPDGEIGIVDWDSVAIGEPAADIANLVVHLELRALQGHCAAERVAHMSTAILRAYSLDPVLRRRLVAFAAAIRLRLCCLYVFRPGSAGVTAKLLERLDAPVAGLDG